MMLLKQTRKSRGLTLQAVAKQVHTDPTNLHRIESGEQLPKRTLARALYAFYGGAVPLGAIYDSKFEDKISRARAELMQSASQEKTTPTD